MITTKPNGQRAKVAIMLVWAVLAAEVLSLISSYLQYNLIETVASGGFISEAAANFNDTREQLIGGLYILLYAGSGYAFILWFRRAYYNLHQRVEAVSHSDGWAAGSWFVPFLCLYLPYRIMKELYSNTRQLLAQHGRSLSLPSTLLGGWWALWIFSNFIGQFLFRYALNAESLDELTNTTVASMLGNVVGIPLALITIKVIGDFAKAEAELWELESGENQATDEGFSDTEFSLA